LCGLLAEYVNDHDGVLVGSVDDSPGSGRIVDPQFVAARADDRQGPRMRQAQHVTLLKPPEQNASPDARLRR
jgi:hypothetical protein